MIPVTPPDGAAWSLEPVRTAAGVAFELRIPEMDTVLVLQLSRVDALSFADGVRAAAGDGTQRTFPHLHNEKA